MPARERGKWSAEAIRRALKLYAVTDNAWLGERTLTECVEEALAGGATFVQLRDKHASAEDLRAEAEELLALCRAAGVPFVVNDDVECALAVGADGVHVGQDDMACERARALLGPDAIVGVSTQTVEQALLAEKHGADYLGVGAVFPTGSKDDADDVSYDTLQAICRAVSIPVVAIGGISLGNVSQLSGSGICGIAVISAIYGAADIRRASLDLKAATEEMLRS